MTRTAVPRQAAPLLEWAQWYAEQGWPVFPCKGKAPLTLHGFQDASIDPFDIGAWWQQWPDANIGSPAGVHWWALDVDPRAGGDSTLFDLEKQHGFLPHTLLSHTGGGGNHYLWTLPQHLAITNKAKLGSGLDVQSTGSYIILPPSIHPDTGNTYIWDLVDGPDDITPQDAPDWLLQLVTQPLPTNGHTTALPLIVNTPIPQGERDNTLAQFGISMAHAGLGYEAILAALTETNQARCEPPLPQTDIERIAHSTSRYLRATLAVQPAPLPALGWSMNGHAPPSIPPPPDWRTHLNVKKSGGLVQDVRNLSLILEHADYWRGQLWWNEIACAPMFGNQRIDEDFLVGIGRWMGTEEHLSVTNLRMLERCVLSRCRVNRHDLLQHWLNNLPPWDKVPRLASWLTDIAGVEPSLYGQEVSRLLPVSMVARALDPGCICRYVVILEGPEECGKSTLVQALASDQWYVVLSLGLDSKDSHMMLQGAWVAEFAELDAMTKTEETRLKAFITMRADSYVPKYSNFRESYPRRTIFIGTTNDESYLKGQTGNTRFLPVRVTQQIDLEGFGFIREQLFAEALAEYQSRPDWWRMSYEASEEAKAEREHRRVVNVYEEDLSKWLEHERFIAPTYYNGKAVIFTHNETSWKEIAQYFLLLKTPAEWKDMTLQKQIAQALKSLGWRRTVLRRSHDVFKAWVKDNR